MKSFFKQINSFNRPQVTVLEQPAAVKNYGTYPKEVYEIHHAFETAGEKILAEAQGILKECESKSIAKGKRLLTLGFGQSKEAVIATETISKEATAKETADMVIYYKVNYPNNKFITETQVKAICEKWNLVCGGINLFKGFVPETNLRMIEQFNLKPKEKNTTLYRVDGTKLSGYIDESQIARESIRGFLDRNNRAYVEYSTGEINIVGGNEKWGRLAQVWKEDFTLKICAPLADMDTTGMRLDGYKLEKHIPDPVVLQPVRGGYLIVTAWGDEATDENVVNQNHN